MYSFVSYNRKQIIPSANHHPDQACIPDFNLRYRLAYIIFVVIFSSCVLSLFSAKLEISPNFGRELIVCLGQIIWQTLFLKAYLKDRIWDYLGNMMTVSLIGTLLLIPSLFLNLGLMVSIIYFGVVVFIMFLEHLRRCRILKLNLLPTLSWMVFRATVLAVLILLNL